MRIRAVIAGTLLASGLASGMSCLTGCATQGLVEPPREVSIGLVGNAGATPGSTAWFESRNDLGQGLDGVPPATAQGWVTVSTWDREWVRDGRIRNQRRSDTRIRSVREIR